MRKRAIVESLSGGWEGLRQHPITGTALSIGSFLPVAGSAISGGDMLQNLYKGNLASAGLNAIGVGAGMLPGGAMLTNLASKGRIGQMAAKAAPYLAPIPGQLPTIPQFFTTPLASAAAGMTDQSMRAGRPAYQKQVREQEKMMRDFNEWRQHKATLQAMGQQPQIKAGQAPTTADMAKKLWDVAYGTSPYLAAATMGGHILPSYYKDDTAGMMRGVLTGGGATAGTIGGFMGGGLSGAALGRLLALRYGIDPSRAAHIGGGVGGVLGGILGHAGGRHAVGSFLNSEDNPQQLKFGNHRSKLAASMPAFSADPVGYVGHQAGRLGGAISGGVERFGHKATEWGDPRTGKVIGNVAGFLGKYPKSVGTAAITLPSLLALRAMTRGDPQPIAPAAPEEKQAAKEPQQRARAQSKRMLEQEGRARASVKPSTVVRPRNPAGVGVAAPEAAPSLASVLEWRVPPQRAEVPGTAALAAPEAMAPGAFASLKAHPTINRIGSFAASPKGQAAILGTLALGGAGAYWAGRRKRKEEDELTGQEVAQAG